MLQISDLYTAHNMDMCFSSLSIFLFNTSSPSAIHPLALPSSTLNTLWVKQNVSCDLEKKSRKIPVSEPTGILQFQIYALYKCILYKFAYCICRDVPLLQMQIFHCRNNHTIHIIIGLFFISCHKNSP
jgi:hypothetical protein